MNFEAVFGMSLTQVLIGFTRTSGLMMTAPVFQSRYISAQLKIVFAFALALVVAPFIQLHTDLTAMKVWVAVALLIEELLVGLIIGYTIGLTFAALQLGGYFFDVSIGFGIVNMIDPNSGAEMPLLGQFNYILSLIVFLAINGHHTMINALIQSFDIIKPGMFFLKKEAVGIILKAFANMFYFGFKIGIPVVGAVFLADVALGIISKLIPQINVFVTGFPIKIFLGLMMIMFFIPVYILLLERVFANSSDTFSILRFMMRQMHQ